MKDVTALKKQSFLQGAFVLICANLLVKVIGAGFKIPLTYLIHEEGMGLFGSAYTVYTILFVIATAGFPIAISKMVSESVAKGRDAEAKRIFRVALMLLICVGIFGTSVIYFGADSFSEFLKMKNAVYAIRAIAPAVFCVSVMSALRGYFQGHQNMYPTAISEVTEAVGKLVVGYILAYKYMQISVEKAAAGAITGVTFGTLMGVLILLLIFFLKKDSAAGKNTEMRSKRSIARELVTIAVPITVGASVSSLTTLIDMATITRRLQSITQITAAFMTKYSSYIDASFNGGIDETLATKLYGLYNGYAIPLFNLPLTIVAAIAMSVVPAIAAAIAKHNKAESETVTKSALRITILLALPCGFGLFVLAKPVLMFLYRNGMAETLLQKLSIAIVFVSLLSVTSAILQAYGRPAIPMFNMLAGGVVKIAVNYVLVGMPEFNIDGAPIGTIVCYFIIVLLNMIWVLRITGCKFSIIDFVAKPVAASAVMAAAAGICYSLLSKTGLNFRLALLGAIAAGGIIYLLLILLIGAIKREDIKMLPKGDVIEKYLTKAKLL